MKSKLVWSLTLLVGAAATSSWGQSSDDGATPRGKSAQEMSAGDQEPGPDTDQKPRRQRNRAGRPGTAGTAQPGKKSQGPGPRGEQASPEQRLQALLKRLDKNADGLLSRDEAPERLASRFDQMDEDGNGSLDRNELARLNGRPNRVATGDVNGDMIPDAAKAGGEGKKRKGPPGDESTAATAGEKKPGKGANPGRKLGAGPGGPAERARALDPALLFQRMDKDQNGSLGKEEVPERMQQRFAEMDLNGDGGLDQEEIGKMREMMNERGRRGDGENDGPDPNEPVQPRRPTRGGGDA